MDVQEYLRQFKQNWKPDFLERVKELPEDLQRGVGVSLSQRRTEEENHIQLLSEKTPEEFRALIPTLSRVFFPQFPEVAGRTLEALLERHTYLLGYSRRAFRAPGHPLQVRRAVNWLNVVWETVREYPEQNLEWFAVHAGLLDGWHSYNLGLLFAQAIDEGNRADGDEAVFQVLKDTASTQHPVARMGRHVPLALLASQSDEAHALAEGLLLAAQRQEGLRQAILESVDEASLAAFKRLLDVILREDLLRFAATLRAACVWFGWQYDVTDTKTVKKLLVQALNHLEDEKQAREAVKSGTGVDAYIALFTLGMKDAVRTAELARELLKDKGPERRMAAVQFLTAAEMLSEADSPTLLADEDVRIGALAARTVNRWVRSSTIKFDDLLAYAQRLPGEARHDPLLFPWLGQLPAKSDVLDSLLAVRGERPFADLAPYLDGMSQYGKLGILEQMQEALKEKKSELDAASRVMLRDLLQDRNSGVSQKAVEVMTLLTPQADEIEVAHTLLKRKSADLRRGIILLLASDKKQGESSALELLSGTNTEQRQAGLQLLGEVGGTPPENFKPKNVTEETLLVRLTSPESALTLKDGLGLFDPAQRTRPVPLQARERDYPADVARGAKLLKSLDDLIEKNKETPLTGVGYDGAQTHLLMNISSWWLRWDDNTDIPLKDLWEKWWHTRPGAQEGDATRMRWAVQHFANRADTTQAELDEELGPYDPDADYSEDEDTESLDEAAQELKETLEEMAETFSNVADLLKQNSGIVEGLLDPQSQEMIDTLIELAGKGDNSVLSDQLMEQVTELKELKEEQQATQQAQADRQELLRLTLHRTLGPLVTLKLNHTRLLGQLVAYFADRFSTPTDTDMSLDAWETALTRLPTGAKMIGDPERHWNQTDPRDLLKPLNIAQTTDFTPEQLRRYWLIDLYQNRAFPNLPELRPDTPLLLKAYENGWANRHDLLDQLIGARPEQEGYSYYGNGFDDLTEYTRRKLREHLPTHPDWMQAVNDVRDRVLDVELTRGDLETPVTLPAQALQSVSGMGLTLRLLAGMGKNPLKRGYSWNNTSKDATFSHLLRVSFPEHGDNAGEFKKLAKDFKLADTRLLDLAMFAPQWAGLVAEALGWKGLHDGVYWLHAHTRDSNWSVPEEVREAWEGEISERTPLKASDLTEGAVDVAWFHRMYRALGKERFHTLLSAAKYASSSGGHKRAELFAGAILGEVKETELLTRINEKRNQDAVRSLGLLPLAKGKKGQQNLEQRYRVLSDFRREAKQFGAQRQASERLAADIGMQNLARTAGYADPQRLMWAMEARMAPDWQKVVTVDGVTVRAEMNEAGEAELHIARGDKVLKNLPPALKKNPDVVALRDAVKELDATRSRMRTALEEAMVRGDHFQNQELQDLSQHPVIAPMLKNLVWVLNERHLGFWQGDTLKTLDGNEKIGEQALRLAHPHDLFTNGHWREYQAHLIEHHLAQPFKQVFREYYPLTPAEQDAKRSTRYEGHHVQPAKAAALLKSRGWVSVYEEGTRKTYHAEGINVWIDDTLGYGTPNEVEGMPLHAAYFMRRDEWEPMPLADVPPRLFSETMRDLDLVVSVAHVGGVDPEASQSTVEMRESLLRETLRLLKLKNVRLENGHALIDGHHSKYTVHLGSGTVHRQPGGFLCIVPVHNQGQGRLFLPFADPDPRTAEVVSKVLLLAEDKKIQDPTILEQLR